MEIAERYLDGHATETEWDVAKQMAQSACDDAHDEKLDCGEVQPTADYAIRTCTAAAATFCLSSTAWDAAWSAAIWTATVQGWKVASSSTWNAAADVARNAEWKEQAAIVRDFFHPFRRVTTSPAWLTSTVTNLAQAIYTDRAFARMPILADALEDAGCTNADILAHCRQPGEHCRGCWVVDLLLGKE